MVLKRHILWSTEQEGDNDVVSMICIYKDMEFINLWSTRGILYLIRSQEYFCNTTRPGVMQGGNRAVPGENHNPPQAGERPLERKSVRAELELTTTGSVISYRSAIPKIILDLMWTRGKTIQRYKRFFFLYLIFIVMCV